ncbi:hypothetical protein GCM10023189_49820 [Nibrella saemangeumensis]|uniref:RiboL-PSP-HEPN domain-containing protein n=1 Tax=Nibrella saemangeumensis TaxID=1084526 RepID=A0ABP8NKB1_9BACT
MFDNSILEGLVHFTDYSSQLVYQVLYQNFYNFESNLREHLTYLNLTYEHVLEYYKYKINKNPSNYFANSRLVFFQNKKTIEEAKALPNLQKLEFKELLEFASSSFHKTSGNAPPLSSGVECKVLGDLRNTIMHSKDFTGSTGEIPHNFSSFKKFFDSVIKFKKLFNDLKLIKHNSNLNRRIKQNIIIFEQLKQMSDQDIHYFFLRKIP